jgi:hypothetical protein
MHGPQGHLFRLAAWPMVAAALLALVQPAAADPADEETALINAVGAAVADGRVTQSKIHGFTPGKESFTESPSQPGVLTGFDLGVGKFSDSENIYGLRAVFLTGGGDEVLKDHGLFHDKLGAKNKQVKSKVQDVVHIRAARGYAVGAVTLRSGLNINGLSVTFMRMKDGKLDPQDSYESDWVGDRTGGEAVIRGNGAPVVGIAGNQDGEKICALGLTFASQPAPAAAPPVVAAPVATPPVAAPPVAAPARPRPPVPPPAAEGAENPRAPVPAEAQPAPAEAQPAPVEPAGEPVAAPTKAASIPASVEKSPPSLFLVYGVAAAAFVAVAALVLVVALSSSHRRGQPQRRPANRPVPPARPPVVAAPPSTAFHAARAPVAPAVVDDVIELCDEDFVPEPVAAAVEAPKAAPPSSDSWPPLEL